jgi:UDP-glucose 4-epimerase
VRHYLITGGAGFIGSHLAEALVAAGHSVHVVDDLSTGSITNLDGLKGKKRFSYSLDTILNESLMAELVDRADCIYHLAAAVGVKLIVQRPVLTIETNIKGTEVVLQMAAKKGRKVIITSTSEVYGKNTSAPFAEDDDMVFGATTRARWIYGCSKAVDEFLALSYYKEKNLPAVIVRLFNTVGPRQTDRYGMVLPTFVRQAMGGGPITVFGDGEQSRCFTYVDNVVDALVKLAECKKAIGQVFNIGSNEEVTINQLARRVKELVNPGAEIIHVPYDQAYEAGFEDMRRRVPDITKISDAVGFKPTFTLDDIIRLVAEYFLKEDRD